MTTKIIHTDSTFTLDVTVHESDKYTGAVYLKFEQEYADKILGCNEMFMTPLQLDSIGRFLVNQANEIQAEQTARRIKERVVTGLEK